MLKIKGNFIIFGDVGLIKVVSVLGFGRSKSHFWKWAFFAYSSHHFCGGSLIPHKKMSTYSMFWRRSLSCFISLFLLPASMLDLRLSNILSGLSYIKIGKFLSLKEFLNYFKSYFGPVVLPKRGWCAVTTDWISWRFFKISAMFFSCSAIRLSIFFAG